TGRPGQDRYMEIHGLGHAERPLQMPLRRYAVEEVPPADDRRDALVGVIEDDREVIGREAVAPPDHVIAEAWNGLRLETALQAVVERSPRLVDAHAHGRIIVRHS